MTTDPAPPPGTELVVARRTRLLRGLGWPLLVMGAGIAVLAALLVIVLVRGAGRDDLVGQLACQVQQLGGEPVGDVDCPPQPSPRVTVRPSPVPAPARTAAPPVVIVLPDGSTRTIAASPAVPRTSSRPAQRPPPPTRPSPTSTARATPSASPLVVVCLPAVRCLPRATPPRREAPR